MPDKRAMLFVDAQNLFHGGNSYSSDFRCDALKLKQELCSDYDLIRAYWFDSYPEGSENNKEHFFYFLDMNGYRVDANPLRERDGGYIEKGADIGLATELIAQGFDDSYEVATVVSGDGDFARAIKYVQDEGKIVNIASFDNHISSDFKRMADNFIQLDEIANDISRD